MQSGWELFLEFALEVGAIGRAEKEELEERSQRAFAQLCALQAKYQQASDPALRFVALLQAALACGRAHVADRRGRAPARGRSGAGSANLPAGGGCRGAPESVGSREATYSWSPQPAIKWPRHWQGPSASVGEQSLRHRLRERGLLVSIDAGRQMVQVRRTLEGSPKQVLHLKASDLAGRATEAHDAVSSKPTAGRH